MNSTAMRAALRAALQTRPGQRVVLVGGPDALGSWDPARGLEMNWNEGHFWCTNSVLLPAG